MSYGESHEASEEMYAWLRPLLDRPIAFHPFFIDVGGSITAALFLSQLFYWSLRTSDHDGWVYKTQAEWKEEIRLSRKQQESARRRLRERGLLEEKLEGLPAQLFYRINQRALVAGIEKRASNYARERLQRMPKTAQSSMPESDISSFIHRLPTEITTESSDVSSGGETRIKGKKERTPNSVESFYIDAVWNAYRISIQPNARICPSEKIKKRLEKFSVEELVQGIHNFAADSWWMEHNANRGGAWFFQSDARSEQFLNLVPRKEGAHGAGRGKEHLRTGASPNRFVSDRELAQAQARYRRLVEDSSIRSESPDAAEGPAGDDEAGSGGS